MLKINLKLNESKKAISTRFVKKIVVLGLVVLTGVCQVSASYAQLPGNETQAEDSKNLEDMKRFLIKECRENCNYLAMLTEEEVVDLFKSHFDRVLRLSQQ